MGLLASLLVKAAGRKPARAFDAATRDPVGAQEQRLRDICTLNAGTEFGREHDFAGVRTLSDFAARVPVCDYEEIRPRIQRMLLGEKNVLVAEDVELFARTSGTSGEPKFIPSTRRCRLEDHVPLIRTWFHHALKAHPGLFRGRVLSLTSSAIEGHTPGGTPYGSVSGLIQQNMPRAVRTSYVAPAELSDTLDHEGRWYALALLGIAADVTFLGTANPSSVLRLVETAQRRSEELLRDLHDGTLRGAPNMEPAIAKAVRSQLKRRTERCTTLENLRRVRGGQLLPADYWPHLELIGCWKGGTVGGHVERFAPWFAPDGRAVPVRDWGWLSSECRGSIPLSDNGSAGVLSVHRVVFEFIPAAQLELPGQPETLPLEALETGQEYGVVVTTGGGLYRYDMNDIVEVVGRHNATPMLMFKRKGRGMTNITGEKLSVNQVIVAVERAARACGVVVDHYRAEADPDESRYILMVESARGIPPMACLPLLVAFDAEIARMNLEYGAKRASGRLHHPVLHVMRRGWYERGKQAIADAGGRMFQSKTVVLRTRSSEEHSEPELIVTEDGNA